MSQAERYLWNINGLQYAILCEVQRKGEQGVENEHVATSNARRFEVANLIANGMLTFNSMTHHLKITDVGVKEIGHFQKMYLD